MRIETSIPSDATPAAQQAACAARRRSARCRRRSRSSKREPIRLTRRSVARRSRARHGRDAAARPQGIHPPEGESGSGLRPHTRDVDGQNVAHLFKWIKQHLRIKRFLGTSENAVKTQIWCAVSTYVLIAIVKKELHLDASLYTCLQILSVSVFERIEVSCALQPDRSQLDPPIAANQLMLFDF